MRRKIVILISTLLLMTTLVGILYLGQKQRSKNDFARSAKLLSITPSATRTNSITPTQTKSISKPTATNKPNQPTTVLLEVPFAAQAPFGEWSDPRQQDGCEEASSLMAVRWALGADIASKQEAKDQIIKANEWQVQNYGSAIDTSVQDTADRIIKTYYGWQKLETKSIESPQEIIQEITAGHLVVLPVNGQILGNPFYTQPGPERHMLVVIGYDPNKLEFITNDPGTRQGKSFRYSVNVLWSSIRDYPTGNHEPITKVNKNMIVVTR
jgi:hypothetical protein